MNTRWLDFPADPAAEKLVTDYLDAVVKASDYWQPRYPHDDMEFVFVGALYRAAWTYRPGKVPFWYWWNRKAKGALSRFRRRAQAYELGLLPKGPAPKGGAKRRGPPIRLVPYSLESVDSIVYYTPMTDPA